MGEHLKSEHAASLSQHTKERPSGAHCSPTIAAPVGDARTY
jgi:hypothetical protein